MGDVTCISSRTTLRNKMFHIENLEELCLVLKELLVVDYNIAFLLSFLLFQPAAPERKLSIQSSAHLTNSDEDDSRTGSPDQGMHNMYHVSQANTVFYIVHCVVLFPAWRDEHNERYLICLFVCLFVLIKPQHVLPAIQRRSNRVAGSTK